MFEFPRTGFLALLLMPLALTGCSAALRSSVDTPFPARPYESRLSAPEVKALYHFALAGVQQAHGDYAEALESLERAASLDPESVYLKLKQAEFKTRQGRIDEAMGMAEAALLEEPGSLDALVMLGNLHMSLGEDLRAAEYFRRAMEVAPERENLYLHLATALARAGLAGDAVKVLRILVERRPGSFMGHYYLAKLHRELGAAREAQAAFRAVIELEPTFEGSYLELADLYEALGESDRAEAIYAEALANLPDSASLHHRLIRSLVARREFRGAVEQIQRLLQFHPQDAEALRKLGLLHFEFRQWPEALEAFEALIRLQPELDQGYYYLASTLEELGRPDEAIAAFEKVSPGAELYQDARLHMAFLLHQSGQTEAGVALLQDVLRRSTNPSLETYRYLSALYEAQEALRAAAEVLRKAMAAYPEEPALAYRLGVVLEKAGLREGSREALKKALEIDPDHVEALNHLSYVYAEAGEHLAEALLMAERAYGFEPSGHIADTLGWVHYRLGNPEAARKYLEEATALLPEDPVVQDHLADVYRALGLLERAAEMYRRVLELDPQAEKTRGKLRRLETSP